MWRKILRVLWPFRGNPVSHEAVAAQQAASLSQVRAQHDRVRAAAQRAVAEELADSIRAHNSANHYDLFLQRVIRGDE